jgi:adenylate cyclase
MLLMLAAGIGALIVATGSTWNVLRVNRVSPAEVGNLTIVVLPFANLSGDPSQDYLADVVTDQLTTYISRIPGTFVIARNTAFTYKGKATDVRQIGKDLGVRYAVEGSVQTAGARVRVNTQLINSETGTHLWAEEFDHDRADLLQMEDDIVTRLARTLQIQLADIEAARLRRAHPVNADVQELAMRCQAAYLGIAILNAAEASFRPCQQALEVDPNNVVALAALSIQASGRVSSSNSSDRRADIAQADELASRALAIDPNSPDAHYSKGSSFQVERRFEEAKAEYERAIALNPSQMNAYQGLSLATLNTGQPEEVIALVEKAIRLSPRDPLRTSWFVLEGLANIMLRRDEQALELLRRVATVNPKPIVPQAWLAAALALTGREAEARETLERYLSMPEARTKTIAAFKKQRNSDNANYLDMRERIYQGLRKAGMPEE